MVVLSLGVFVIQNSELRVHGDIQGKALGPGCSFQGILAFQLCQQMGSEVRAQLKDVEQIYIVCVCVAECMDDYFPGKKKIYLIER